MGTLAYLPRVRMAHACLPDSAMTPEDALCVELEDDLLSGLGAGRGHIAIISLTEEPKHGEAGAVRRDGTTYVGHLFFPATGGVMLGSAGGERMSTFFDAGTYEVLGRVDRVCSSCEGQACRVVPRGSGLPEGTGVNRRNGPLLPTLLEVEAGLTMFRRDVGMMRWHTDEHGYHLVTDEMRAWITLAGGDPDAWAGSGWIDFLHSDDKEAYLSRWSEAIELGKPYLNHGRICISGIWLYMVVSANPVRDDSGRIVGWTGFLHFEEVEVRKSA